MEENVRFLGATWTHTTTKWQFPTHNLWADVKLLPLLVCTRRLGQYGFSIPSTHLLTLLKDCLRRAFNECQVYVSWYTLMGVLVQV